MKMFRSKSWFGGVLWKPKNPHSLEHLKYLYNVLSKNQTVSENNRGLLVETLRSIAEILIWGDQNDSSVFDFFLEKNMLSFFLKILKQKCGSYVCVQLLQTLNILFENIRKETSLYYLLSNNHVNLIIVHKFDFSDEEVMAYYISFLKTLSLKLNAHTVHFFYNEHTNDFPLYTEAIKFFKHPESMVRIAVRTLTLNVYRVEDKSMLKFIRNKTAAPYFSNLVWFIGNHVLELDTCVKNDADHLSHNRLADLVAEHLDHLHYLNDILSLNIEDLNEVLTDHLLNRLFIPLYVFSLLPGQFEDGKPKMSSVVSLFLLSQVFLISSQRPLVNVLAEIILRGTVEMLGASDWTQQNSQGAACLKPGFVAPTESLEDSLDSVSNGSANDRPSIVEETPKLVPNLNITDEEKEQRLAQEGVVPVFLEAITSYLICLENDYSALFALCLLHAISHNPGINRELLDTILLPSASVEVKQRYNTWLVEKLIDIITLSCQPGCGVRLVTLELTIAFLLRLVVLDSVSLLHDCHLAAVVGAKEESTSLLRNFYKSEDIFLDMFEDEYEEMKKRPLNVEWLMMDSNVLLPPTGTPMTGIEFTRRLPCGEVERARRAIRVFLLVRELSLTLAGETETQLPLTNRSACVQVDNVLDLNNSDLIACTVINKDGTKTRRFLVMDSTQLILVEPDHRRLGWGVAKMAGFLQDMEVIGDKDDSRCLHVTIHHTTTGPLIAAKFVFDDHIRCMAAKQRLTKGRLKARQKKMVQIARLLELPTNAQPTPSPPAYNLLALRQSVHHYRNPSGRSLLNHRPPGFAALVKPPSSPKLKEKERERKSSNASVSTSNSEGGAPVPRSREGSPKLPRPRSEEIPLEDIITKRNSMTSTCVSTTSTVESQVEPVASGAVGTTADSNSGSIETSFSSSDTRIREQEQERERRKGKVETV